MITAVERYGTEGNNAKTESKGQTEFPNVSASSLHLEEVLDTLRVVAVALSTDPLHLFDLACLAGSLDVFEVNFRILTEVYNRAQEVEQT